MRIFRRDQKPIRVDTSMAILQFIFFVSDLDSEGDSLVSRSAVCWCIFAVADTLSTRSLPHLLFNFEPEVFPLGSVSDLVPGTMV